MKVSEAVSLLQGLPQDLEIMDQYAENALGYLYLSEYDDDSGSHPYVAFEIAET